VPVIRLLYSMKFSPSEFRLGSGGRCTGACRASSRKALIACCSVITGSLDAALPLAGEAAWAGGCVGDARSPVN